MTELKDPITGEVIALTTEVKEATETVEVVEKTEEEKKQEKRLELHKKLDELQAGRLLDEIPLNDEYYKFKTENQNSL